MNRSSREELHRRLSERDLDKAIDDAQKADETPLVRRLCFVKNLYVGETRTEAWETRRCLPADQKSQGTRLD